MSWNILLWETKYRNSQHNENYCHRCLLSIPIKKFPLLGFSISDRKVWENS